MNIFVMNTLGMLIKCLALLLVVGVALFMCYPTIMYYVNMESSKSLPYPSDHFTGRDDAMSTIAGWFDSKTRIVSVIGSPGFGKSTLAIHIGHLMLKRGYIVHYVNLDEFPRKKIKQILAEKVLDSSDVRDKAITFDRLLRWARERYFYTLIILDNCDESLHYQKEELQDAIKKVIKNSHVKFLMTSREATIDTSSFEQYKLDTLSTKAACDLLQFKAPMRITLTASEKEEIAELTGKVPLALLIIGSLLQLPDIAGTGAIIAKLKKQPIPTLSPKQLPKKEQINASFSLSYDYLSTNEKMIGKLLANFPGSFDKAAYISVLKHGFIQANSNAEVENIINDAVEVLVQRSLLEYQGRNDRYHFHRLIREFFLKLHKEATSNYSEEIVTFTANFQKYYFGVLYAASNDFKTPSYMKSVSTLDNERHNFLQLIEDMKKHNVIYFNIAAIVNALDTGYLACRFSSDELLQIIQISAACLIHLNRKDFPDTETGLEYLNLVYKLIKLKWTSHSAEKALVLYGDYAATVGSFKPPPQFEQVSYYVRIQVLVGELYTLVGEHEHAIQHYKYALNFSQRSLEKCKNGTHCSYIDLGEYHYLGNDYEKAAYFYNLSVTVENLNLFTSFEVLLRLNQIYKKLYKKDAAKKVLKDIVSLLPNVLKLQSHEVYQHMEFIHNLISFLQENELANKAYMLYESVAQALIDIGPDNHPDRIIYLLDLLNKKQNYTEVVKLGMHALKKLPPNSELHRVNISYFIGLATLNSGNYSEGLDYLEYVMNYIIHNTSAHKFEKYGICCLLLVPRYKYLHICFVSPILRVLPIVVTNVLYYTFVSPFNCFPTNTRSHDIGSDLTQPVASSRKELEVINNNDPLGMLLKNNLFPYTQQLEWTRINYWYKFFKYPPICFCLNVASISIRIDVILVLLSSVILNIVNIIHILRVCICWCFKPLVPFLARVYLYFLTNTYLQDVLLLCVYVIEVTHKNAHYYFYTLPFDFAKMNIINQIILLTPYFIILFSIFLIFYIAILYCQIMLIVKCMQYIYTLLLSLISFFYVF